MAMGVWESFGSISNLEESVFEKGEIARNPTIGKCGCKYAPLGKSVLFRTQKNFGYKYGADRRDKNSANLGRNISEVNEDFETNERRNVIGIISIQGDAIFTTGREMFIEYITLRVQEELGGDIY